MNQPMSRKTAPQYQAVNIGPVKSRQFRTFQTTRKSSLFLPRQIRDFFAAARP
jgi:hypothetical protein